ncbi:MAG: hypothetical protein J7621_06100 [Niastella sp.]|nr:hypothetical protein [Niastella sp.]
MVKEPKNIDFVTTGKQPTEQEFALVSEWIKKKKEQDKARRSKSRLAKRKKTGA